MNTIKYNDVNIYKDNIMISKNNFKISFKLKATIFYKTIFKNQEKWKKY